MGNVVSMMPQSFINFRLTSIFLSFLTFIPYFFSKFLKFWIQIISYKEIMASQMSLGQIQWIQYLETTDICVDRNGVRHRIEHGYYRGEFEYDQIKPDGYLFIDDKHYFFEFLGNISFRDFVLYFSRLQIPSRLLHSRSCN